LGVLNAGRDAGFEFPMVNVQVTVLTLARAEPIPIVSDNWENDPPSVEPDECDVQCTHMRILVWIFPERKNPALRTTRRQRLDFGLPHQVSRGERTSGSVAHMGLNARTTGSIIRAR